MALATASRRSNMTEVFAACGLAKNDRQAASGGEVPPCDAFSFHSLSRCSSSPGFAHPVPKTNRDRTLVVHVTATALVVDYRLELDEGSIPNELTSTERAHVSPRATNCRTFTQSFAEATCRTLDALLDGRELRFRCIQQKYSAGDHVRCDDCFESAWNLTPGTEYKLKFHDTNYNTDDFSRLYIYLTADESVHFLSAKAPSRELMSRSSDDRKPGERQSPPPC